VCGELPEGARPFGGGWIKNTTEDVPQRNKFTTPNHKSTRASTAEACLTSQFEEGTPTGGIDITGYEDARLKVTNPRELARCHVISNQVDGLGEENNLVPCWQRGTNIGMSGYTTDNMRKWEKIVSDTAKNLQGGRVIKYFVQPRYADATSTIPYEISMTAIVVNPDGTVNPLFTNEPVPNINPKTGINLGN
jgi:hypothetical protein